VNLSIRGKSQGSGEKRITSVYTNFQGVLGIYQLNKHAQKLPFVWWYSDCVPVSQYHHYNYSRTISHELEQEQFVETAYF